MKKTWLNNKQPDENGDYHLVIENGNGHRISTFKGKNFEDIAEQVADAQINANRQLSRLKPDTGRQPLVVQPRELTPADRLRLTNEINDPNTIDKAVNEIVTASQGAAPSTIGRTLNEIDQKALDDYYNQEAVAFVADFPEYYPIPENQQALFQALEAHHYDLTRNNLAIVYNELFHAGKMVPWPDSNDDGSEEQPPALPVPTPPQPPRPRNISTGLRNTDASASRPAPKPRSPIVTKAELERMSRAEYNEKIRDPIFRRAVDALA
jgi:hypothetical protein